MTNKPYSQASENNKKPILAILEDIFADNKHILEIGSGTGQHAVFFAQNLPHLLWQTSDLLSNHQGINMWLDESTLTNVQPPILLDLNEAWPTPTNNLPIDGVFSANTLHIISWSLVVKLFEGLSQNLSLGGKACFYGPFKYQDAFTTDSNAEFDSWLKDRDGNSGIRDIEDVLLLADSVGLKLIKDHQMPANNQLLHFEKVQ